MQESEDPYSRYYVQRAGHFFSKSTKILNIFSKYFTLCNLTLTKSKSEREIFLFVDVMDILLSEKNDKDIIINLKKNNLTITTSERILLISDLLYMKERCTDAVKITSYKGWRQVDLANVQSKITIRIFIFKTLLKIYYNAELEDISLSNVDTHKSYIIPYSTVDCLSMMPTGFLVQKKSSYEKFILGNDFSEEIINNIKTNAKIHLGVSINVKSEGTYTEKKLLESDEYCIPTCITLRTGQELEMRVHVDSSFLVEEEIRENRVLKKIKICEIKAIFVTQTLQILNHLPNVYTAAVIKTKLQLPVEEEKQSKSKSESKSEWENVGVEESKCRKRDQKQEEQEFVTRVKIIVSGNDVLKYNLNQSNTDYLLSTLFHSYSMNDNPGIDKHSLTFIDLLPPVFINQTKINYKIFAFGNEVDPNYETAIMKELCEINPADSRLSKLLLECALNANFRNFQNYDQKMFQYLLNLICGIENKLLTLEEDDDIFFSYLSLNVNKKDENVAGSDTQKGTDLFVLLNDKDGQMLRDLYKMMGSLLITIRNMLNSRNWFSEITLYEKQVQSIIELINSRNSVISFLSSMIIRSIVKFSKPLEKKLEMLNKKWLIRDLAIIPTLTHLLQKFVKFDSSTFDELFSVKLKIPDANYLHVYGIVCIFEVIMLDRKESTHAEDYKFTISQILENDIMLHTLQKLSMYHSKPIVYHSSLIIAQTLLYLYNNSDKSEYQSWQNYILTYTSILNWHLYLLVSSASTRQQRLSASVVSLILSNNEDCCSFISRIFPMSLFKKVDSDCQSLEWKPENWKEFFILIRNNYNSATEQWNDECRAELIQNLKFTVRDFMQAKENHESKREADEEKLKWNYEEYQINYHCLAEKYKVWKYYLSDLLNLHDGIFPYLNEPITQPVKFWNKLIHRFLGTLDQNEHQLILKILNLVYHDHFQLIREMQILPYFVRLLEEEKSRHIHVLLLEIIYTSLKTHYKDIVLANLQLILDSKGLEKLLNMLSEVYKQKKRGSSTRESPPMKTTKLERLGSDIGADRLTFNSGGVINSPRTGKLYLATKSDSTNIMNLSTGSGKYVSSSTGRNRGSCADYLPSSYNAQNNTPKKLSLSYSRNVNVKISSTTIRILDIMLKISDRKNVFPKSVIRTECEKPKAFEAIVHTLLLQSTELRKRTMKFISSYFCTRDNFSLLCDAGVIEMLILCIDNKSGEESLTLLKKINKNAAPLVNQSFQFSLFSKVDIDLIESDPKIKNSIFLRFLPVPFVKYIAENSIKDCLKIFNSNNYVSPELIWNQEMRLHLIECLIIHITPFLEKLELIGNGGLQKMPEKVGRFTERIRYENVEREVRCSHYYLKEWVTSLTQGNLELHSNTWNQVPQQNYFLFHLEATLHEFADDFNQSKIMDFQIVIAAFQLALKRFQKKCFSGYEDLGKIIEFFCKNDRLSMESRSNLKILTKFIYKTITLNDRSFAVFEESSCVSKIVEISRSLICSLKKRHICTRTKYYKRTIPEAMEDEESSFKEEEDLDELELESNNELFHVNARDISTLKWCMVILLQIGDKNANSWIALPYHARVLFIHDLFLFLDFSLLCVRSNTCAQNKVSGTKKVKYELMSKLKSVKYQKDKSTNYDKTLKTLLEESKEATKVLDSYIISSLINLAELSLHFTSIISQQLESHRELIITGYCWRLLEFIFYPNELVYASLKAHWAFDNLIFLALMTIRHLNAFASKYRQLHEEMGEDMSKLENGLSPSEEIYPLSPSHSLSNYLPILEEYYRVMLSLVSPYIILLLTSTIEISNNRIRETNSKQVQDNLQSLVEKLMKDIKNPQLIWDADTRAQLQCLIGIQIRSIMERFGNCSYAEYSFVKKRSVGSGDREHFEAEQIHFKFSSPKKNRGDSDCSPHALLPPREDIQQSEEDTLWDEEDLLTAERTFADKLQNVQYTSYNTEIIIDHIYVRLFNKDPYFKLREPGRCMRSLLTCLQNDTQLCFQNNWGVVERDNAAIEALTNIITFQNGIELGFINKNNIQILCNFIDPQTPNDPHLEKIFNYIFMIFSTVTTRIKHTQIIMANEPFIKFIFSTLYFVKNTNLLEKVLEIIESILKLEECDETLNVYGVTLLLMRLSYMEDLERKFRITAFTLLKKILTRPLSKDHNKRIFSIFVPSMIIQEILEEGERTSEEWISYLTEEKETINLIYKRNLISKIIECLNTEADKLYNELHSTSFKESFIWNPPKLSPIAPLVNHNEIVVADVVIRIYNQCPFVNVQKSLLNLIEQICEQISKNLSLITSLMHERRLTCVELEEESKLMQQNPFEEEKEIPEDSEKAEFYECVDGLQKGLLSLMTSLLFSIEQLVLNAHQNPNCKQLAKSKTEGLAYLTGLSLDFIRSFISLVLTNTYILENKITLLEIIYLILEKGGYRNPSIAFFNKSDMLALCEGLLDSLGDSEETHTSQTEQLQKVKDILIFCILMKIVDSSPKGNTIEKHVEMIVEEKTLALFKALYKTKGYLKKYIKILLHKACQNQHYRTILSQNLPSEGSDNDLQMKKIVQIRYDSNIEHLWRTTPLSIEKCRETYGKTGMLEEMMMEFESGGGGSKTSDLEEVLGEHIGSEGKKEGEERSGLGESENVEEVKMNQCVLQTLPLISNKALTHNNYIKAHNYFHQLYSSPKNKRHSKIHQPS